MQSRLQGIGSWAAALAVMVGASASGCDAKRLVKDRHVATGDPPGPFEVGGMLGGTTTARQPAGPGVAAHEAGHHAGAAANRAVARLAPTQGHNVQGSLQLSSEQGKVHIVGQLTGFAGAGPHGFHVHEVGNCQSPDGKSAGEHFSAMPHPHGGPGAELNARHTGDLGNITSDASGTAHVDAWTDVPLLTPGPEFALGRALIVHASADDLATQPSGNSGARVACGVIEAPQP